MKFLIPDTRVPAVLNILLSRFFMLMLISLNSDVRSFLGNLDHHTSPRADGKTDRTKIPPAQVHAELSVGNIKSFDKRNDGRSSNLVGVRTTATRALVNLTELVVEHQKDGDVRIAALHAA